MYETDRNQARQWFYIMAGSLCSLLFVNVVIADLFAVYLMWQSNQP